MPKKGKKKAEEKAEQQKTEESKKAWSPIKPLTT